MAKVPPRPMRSLWAPRLRTKPKKIPSAGPSLRAIQADRRTVMRILASVLRGARQDADLTQMQIAQAIGSTEDVVSNIEALRSPISWPNAILWARRCGMREAKLFRRYLYELSEANLGGGSL